MHITFGTKYMRFGNLVWRGSLFPSAQIAPPSFITITLDHLVITWAIASNWWFLSLANWFGTCDERIYDGHLSSNRGYGGWAKLWEGHTIAECNLKDVQKHWPPSSTQDEVATVVSSQLVCSINMAHVHVVIVVINNLGDLEDLSWVITKRSTNRSRIGRSWSWSSSIPSNHFQSSVVCGEQVHPSVIDEPH